MKQTEKLKAILVIETGFLILFLLSKQKHGWLLYTAAGIGLVSLVLPLAGDWIVKIWFKLAEVLGWINSRIILSIIFYVFLLPIALIARRSKNNPFKLKRTGTNSFYEERNHKYTKEDLENVW